jgi:flagellar hook-associated protein 1 FlgK
MPSTFFGLNISRSGLYAASVNLNVTANNVANADTKGYSRQEATQVAKDALRVFQDYGMIGAGVNVTSIDRVRDSFYDEKYWSNQSKLGSAEAKYYYETQMENHLNEFEVDGFTKEYTNFFESLEELEKNPSDLSARTSVLNYGQSMMAFLEQVKTNLRLEQEDINAEINDYVDKINTLASEAAVLNKQINIIELTGASANELRDKRDLVIDELSQICEVQTEEKVWDNGKTEYKIMLGNNTLVDTYNTFKVKVVTRDEKADDDDVVGLYDIYWDYNEELNPVKSGLDGELSGLLMARDGNNNTPNEDSDTSYSIDYKGITYYINEINRFQEAFANTINEIHAQGENLYGESTEDTPIFVKGEGNVWDVNPELLADPSKMATTYDLTSGVSNFDLAQDLLDVKDAKILENFSSEEFLQSIVTELGVEVKKQETLQTNYENFQEVIQNQRLSVMGVDEDEEAMNLVKYQEAFDLNAKVMSIMQEIYDTLINSTGV